MSEETRKQETPVFFETPVAFRAWLETHHENAREQWVGFHKKGSGRPSLTWPESVDEALCFGWIDGVRKRIDEDSYKIRFTPRKTGSIWSAVNLRKVEELQAQGRMLPAGLRAYEKRKEEKSVIYAYEQETEAKLSEAEEEAFRGQSEAWAFFERQPASYRNSALWWVISAKKPETRAKRLAELMDDCLHERKIKRLGYS